MTNYRGSSEGPTQMHLALCLAVMTLVSTPLVAAEIPAIKSAKCRFTGATNNFFDDGRLTSRPTLNATEVMETTFDQIDNPDGNARMIGNNGGADVTVIQGAYELNLIELTPTGNMMVTSLHIGGGYEHGGQVQAVYSRHSANATALLPSQRVGTCTVYTY